ncbi:MAG: kynureninase [Actinobacteria bacterium]|nr:kynureninase [Actinomycetota bacterium]
MTFLERAHDLDAADPLKGYLDRFVDPGDGNVLAYLDGNSLGRPLKITAGRLEEFVDGQWAQRLIRGWTDEWMEWPHSIGDAIGAAALGAAPGQVVVADSTTVMLYKLARAAVATRPGRTEIIIDTHNFPTDRYVVESIAEERSLSIVWIDTDPEGGITADDVAAAVGPSTALALFSHVAYRSGHLADMAAITRVVHDAGALILWDLSHSVGSVPVHLDECDVDFAVGCTYKYLNGGPGAPAFGYVRMNLQEQVSQPIWGWLGRVDAFEMEPGYEPAAGIRRIISGTPPIIAMIPVRAGVELVAEAGIEAIRAKSIALTEFAIEVVDSWPAELQVTIGSPRDSASRGGHVTIRRADFRELTPLLWEHGVIPDFRAPDGIRLGLSPLSTSFVELHRGLETISELSSRDR